MRTVLQVPMTMDLRTAAAEDLGSSSLQEAVRILLKKLAKRQMTVGIGETIQLSPKIIKRYDKMLSSNRMVFAVNTVSSNFNAD